MLLLHRINDEIMKVKNPAHAGFFIVHFQESTLIHETGMFLV